MGSVASPWLFDLFMDDCLLGLKESDCGLEIRETLGKYLVYADDQVLASSACDLQDTVSLMYESFKKKGIRMNVSKTKLMVIQSV